MTTLILAIGNSTSRLAVMQDFTPIHVRSFPTAEIPAETALRASFEELYSKHQISASVICSVVPSAAHRLEDIRLQVDPVPSVIVDPRRRLWFDSHYETMETLGSDRWCAVIAAREEYGYPSVVVDCGTAITINVIDPEGNFAGGNILPGITTSFRALNLHTAQLPDARGGGIPPLVGTNTYDSIRAGVLHTVAQGVEGVIHEIEFDYRGPFRVVLTGGDAPLFMLAKNRKRIVDPDLVLKGAVRYLVGR